MFNLFLTLQHLVIKSITNLKNFFFEDNQHVSRNSNRSISAAPPSQKFVNQQANEL